MFDVNDIKTLREKTGAGMLDCKKALEANNGDIDAAVDWLREKGISTAAKKESRIAAEGLTDIVIDGNKAIIIEVNSETDFVAKNENFQEFIKVVAETILNSDVMTLEEALKLNTDKGTINEYLVTLISQIGEKLSFRRFEVLNKKDDEVFGKYIHGEGKISALTVIKGENEEVAKDASMHLAAMNPRYFSREDISSEDLEKEKTIIKEQAINEGKTPEIAEKMVTGRINKFYKEECFLEQSFVKNPDQNVESFFKENNSSFVTAVRYAVGEGIEKRNEDFASEVMSQIKA